MCTCAGTYPASFTVPSDAAGPSAGVVYTDDFLNLLNSQTRTGGGGTVTNVIPASANHPGILQLLITAVADLAVGVMGFITSLILAAGNTLVVEWNLAINTLSDGVDNVTLRVGAGDIQITGNDQNNGVYFECDWATHGNANTWFACTANGGVRTKVSTGVAPVAGAFQKLRVVATTTAVNYYINGALVATITANIPAQSMTAIVQSVKQLGATLRTIFVDYYVVQYQIGAGR